MNYIKNDERRRNRHGFGNQNVMGRVFTAPPVLLFFLFTFIPIIMAVVISFTDYDIVNAPRFVGLYNYRKMINDEFFGLPSRTRAYIRFCMCRAACSSLWEQPCT